MTIQMPYPELIPHLVQQAFNAAECHDFPEAQKYCYTILCEQKRVKNNKEEKAIIAQAMQELYASSYPAIQDMLKTHTVQPN